MPSQHAIESGAVRTVQNAVSRSVAEDPRCIEYGLPAGSEPNMGTWPGLPLAAMDCNVRVRGNAEKLYPRAPAREHAG